MSDKALTFLYEATKIVPKTQCGTFIRCQLLAKCHALNNLHLPAQNFKTSIMCQGCGIELADTPPQTKVKSPSKRTKLVKKIEKKLERNKPLSKHLSNIYKSFLKNNFQQIITKCQLCTKKNIVKISKPNNLHESIFTEENTKKHNRKKKKNKLFAGLNKSAVLSVSSNTSNKSVKITENCNKNTVIANQNVENNTTADFIPLDTASTSMLITKNILSDNRSVSLAVHKNNTNTINAKNKTNNNVTNNSSKKSKLKSKKNKFQNGRVQKNEVLKKTEKNTKKINKKLKNLASMLNQKESSSNSLATFLKHL